MNFTISKKQILDSLTIVCKAISSTTPLPILSGVRFLVEENQIALYGSDSNISIRAIITNEDESLQVKEEGEQVIDAKYILEIIRRIDSNVISFELIDTNLIRISGGSSEFKINSLSVSEYPQIQFDSMTPSFRLKTEEFANAVSKTSFACSTNETRPALTGVNLRMSGGKLTVTATDSYRVAYKTIAVEGGQDFNITVPCKYIQDISRSIYSKEVDISVDNQQIFFKFGNIIIKTRLLDDAFPDTSRLIPPAFSQTLKVSGRAFVSVLEQTQIIKSEGKNTVRLVMNETGIDLSLSDSVSSFHGQVPVLGYTGAPLTLSCSGKFLTDAIKTIESDIISIYFSGELRPMILKDDQDESLIQLISPVRSYR